MTYENYKKIFEELKELGKEFRKEKEEVKAEIAEKLADNLNGNEFKLIVNTVVPANGFCPGKSITFNKFFENDFKKMVEDITNCRYKSSLENRFGFFLKRKNGEEHYFAVWQDGRKFN
jgi:hypothetical protein